MKRCISKVGRQFCHGVKGYIDVGMLVELLSELFVGLLVLSVTLVSAASTVIPQLTNLVSADSGQEAAVELQMVEVAVAAYQTDHDGDLPTVEGFPCASEMDEYIPGGVAVLQGTYTLDGTTGEVAQTYYPASSGLFSSLALLDSLG
jgi:competence protein ComGC